MKQEQEKPETNHVSTRIGMDLKKRGLEYAAQGERLPSWVWAKAIELGLPEVIKRYPPAAKKNRAA